jgi:hypothetical protein
MHLCFLIAALTGLAERHPPSFSAEDKIAFNIARLYRDANARCIWEGKIDVLAADVVRAIAGKRGAEARCVMGVWVAGRTGQRGKEWEAEARGVSDQGEKLVDLFEEGSAEDPTYAGARFWSVSRDRQSDAARL